MAEKWLVVKGYWVMAFDYFRAEGTLPEKHFGLVPYFMICRSLELCLKAFLADKGSTLKELGSSKFGHNLEALLSDSEVKGLGTFYSGIAGLRKQVKWLNKYYMHKQFEYSEIGFLTLPELTALRESVSKLILTTECLWREPERDHASKL